MHEEIRFEVSLERPPVRWQDWEAFGVAFAQEAPAQALQLLADHVQDRVLDEVCGPRWSPVRGVAAPPSVSGL